MVRLEEVAPIDRRPVATKPDLDYPMISARSFGRGTFHQPALKGSEITWERLFLVRAGDLLVSNIKAWEGAVSIVGDEDDGRFCSHRYITCRANLDRVDPSWLAAFFKTGAGVDQLAAASPGSADRNRTLSMDGLRNVLIPLPSLPEQRVIVSRLNAAESCGAGRAKLASAIHAECGALLQKAFDQSIEGAPLMPIGIVAPISRRPVQITPNGRYAEIGVRSFGRGLFAKPVLLGHELTWQKLFRVTAGDIVISNIKAWEGAFAVSREEHEGMVGSHRYLTCVADTEKVLPDFLWFSLQSPQGLMAIQATSPGSADRNRTLSQVGFETIRTPVPSIDAQRWFVGLMESIGRVRAAQVSASREIAQLIPALLHEAFGTFAEHG